MAEAISLQLLVCLLVVSSGVSGREKRQATAPAQPLVPSTCISSTSPTPIPLLTTPTDCSLGEVQHSLDGSEELRVGGLYLMPEAIACNGELVLVETCAFLNQLMNTTRFRLRVVVYRERTDTHELESIYLQALDIRSNGNTTQGCGTLSRVPRQWPVKKGDRVGVQIRDTCDGANDRDPACPAQANLIDATCASALYHTSDRASRIRLSEVTTVGVNLNVRVSIVPTTSQPLLQSTCISSRYLTPTSLPRLTPVTNCSLGEVKQMLEDSEELRAGGLYLMPEAVSCDGDLVLVQTCAFLNRLMETTLFRLRVVVYRERTDTHELYLIYLQALDIRSNTTQGCGNLSRVPRQLSVKKGDRVGVQIRDTCDRPNDPDPACPAQANLIDTACASALYLPPLSTPCTLSDFTVVGVNLNMRVSIEPTRPAPQPTTVLQPAARVPTTSQLLLQSISTSLSYVTPSPLHTQTTVPTPLLRCTSTSLRYVTLSSLQIVPTVPTTSQPLPQSISTSLRYVTPSPLQSRPTEIGDQQPVLSPGQIAGIAIVAVTFALLFLTVVSLVICWLRIRTIHSKRPNCDGQTIQFKNVAMQSAYHQVPQPRTRPFDALRAPGAQTDTTTRSQVSEQLHLLPQNLVINGSCIKLLKSIGEGAFGIVYKAHYSRHDSSAVETVAVKSLKAIFTSGDLQNLVKEIQLMQFLDHPNVMPLLGVCLNSGCPEAESAPCLVMPYMANGSLLAYLRKAKKILVLQKDATAEQVGQVQRELFKMCYEIALGMNYLARNKLVHRDLSARNCMMGSDGTIKVSDFGLSEDIYTKNYFRVDTSKPIAVPFKWMPLESLEEGIYNEKTDMWSFGITSWEIFTGGKIPYTAMSVREVLQLLKSGGRLDKPENAACSEDIYTMMLDCWKDDPEKRPCFLQVVTTLSNMLQRVSGYLDLQVEKSLRLLLPPTDPPTPMKEAPPSPSSPYEI